MSTVLLETIDFHKYFQEPPKSAIDFLLRRKRISKAVDGVNLKVHKGKTLGLVGESGCGKTTLGKTILRFYEPTSGQIIFDGLDITHIERRALKPLRRRMQMIYQNPYLSLNPRKKIGEIISQPMEFHGIEKSISRISSILSQVGLSPDTSCKYPHQLSGGQRQRVAIARAISLSPELVVADEVTSALDVSVQAQILNLLMDLRKNLGISYLYISHDLSVIKHISDNVAVMYLGRIVEEATSNELFDNPLHPYTQALISSVPHLETGAAWEPPRLKGEPSSATNIPSGCRFHPRCPYAKNICLENDPLLRNSKHGVACHLYN